MMTPETKKSKRVSKFGRKGDERMHRSLQARLADPKLSLLDALILGGYRFTTDETGKTLDSDKVQLSQRRNQLSRRLRLFKQQVKTECKNPDAGCCNNKEDPPPCCLPKEDEAPSPSELVDERKSPCSRLSTDTAADTSNEDSDVTPVAYYNHVHFQQQQRQNPPSCVKMQLSGIPNVTGCTRSQNSTCSLNLQNRSAAMMSGSSGCSRAQISSSCPAPAASDMQNRALNIFQADVAALIKKSMLVAGYQREQTEECDDAYLSFVEKALEGESKRVQRIRKRLQHKNVDNHHSSITHNHNHNPPSHNHFRANGYSHYSAQHNDHSHLSNRSLAHHNHDSIQTRKRTRDAELANANASISGINGSRIPKAFSKDCVHTRHLHRLEGKCGHKAILHRPPDGNPHIDFLVDGKIECYQNCQPMTNSAASAFWPSKFRCNQLVDHEHAKDEKCVSCEEKGCKPPLFDPTIFDLEDIDFNCGEWKPGILGNDDSVDDEAILGSLLKLSETAVSDTMSEGRG